MLTPALITALTVIGAPVLCALIMAGRRCILGAAAVTQERCLVILSNLFSFFPVAAIAWNQVYVIGRAGWHEVFPPAAAMASTAGSGRVVYESGISLVGNESLLALAFFYAGAVMANALRRDIFKTD